MEYPKICFGKNKKNPQIMNSILIKALGWLDKVANASSAFTHPLDKKAIKDAAFVLADIGISADELNSIKDICRRYFGWKDAASKVLINEIKKAMEHGGNNKSPHLSTEKILNMWNVTEDELPHKGYLRRVEIDGLWGLLDVNWADLKDDVNVIIGINGEGKTTLLNCIYDEAMKKKCENAFKIILESSKEKLYPVIYLRSYDSTIIDKRKNESWLLQELNNVVYQNQSSMSFFDYRMRILNTRKEEIRNQIQKRIDDFFKIVNSFFADSHKVIEFATEKIASIVFKDINSGSFVPLNRLSAGEKQLLLILFKVFLQEEKPFITLIDEPETSLHISWQSKLIDTLRKLNPNSQFIIATQSPSILSKGWMDKTTKINKLIKE